MNKTNVTLNTATGTSKLVRAKFGPGMLLQHEDLELLNTYTRDLSRLMFRSFFGCGVVCGLVVTGEEKCGRLLITVGAGLALDCNGDPIHLPKDQQVWVGDECEEIQCHLWVVLCGTTKCCAPRTAMCASDDDEPTSPCTREWDAYEIRVMPDVPKCICKCAANESNAAEVRSTGTTASGDLCRCADPTLECYVDHYAGKCGCHCGEGCDCDCNCILLAKLSDPGEGKSNWIQDHSVRRFIRPVLMRDPQVQVEKDKAKQIGAPSVTASQAQAHAQAQAQPDPKKPPKKAT